MSSLFLAERLGKAIIRFKLLELLTLLFYTHNAKALPSKRNPADALSRRSDDGGGPKCGGLRGWRPVELVTLAEVEKAHARVKPFGTTAGAVAPVYKNLRR